MVAYDPPMRPLTILSSICIPGSGQFSAGHPWRGLAWIAAMVAAIAASPWLGLLPPLLVWVAQVVDAGLVESEAHGALYQLGGLAACLTAGVVGGLVVRQTCTEAFRIPSGGMIPTLQVGDHIMTSKWRLAPRRGDIIVFEFPKNPRIDLVKRVVAVGGDTVEIRDNVLFINGRPVPRQRVDGDCSYEDYLDETAQWETRRCVAWDETLDGRTYRVYYDADGGMHSWAPRQVPPGHFFVMGDNRDNSNDSRFWGTVPSENLRALPRIIYWSSGPDGVRWDRVNRRLR